MVSRLLCVLGLASRTPQRHRKNQNRTGDTHLDSQMIGHELRSLGIEASLSDRRRGAMQACRHADIKHQNRSRVHQRMKMI
jgi:hypothetical protein